MEPTIEEPIQPPAPEPWPLSAAERQSGPGTTAPGSGRGRSAILAAILSFVIPGLGQIYAGRFWRGVIISIPQFAILLLLGYEYVNKTLPGFLVQYAFGAVVVNVLFLIYRAYATIDAYVLARGSGAPGPARTGKTTATLGVVVLALLLVADVGIHGIAAATSYTTYTHLTGIFHGCDNLDPTLPLPAECQTADASPSSSLPARTFSTATPSPTAGPTLAGATPSPTSNATDTPGPTDTAGPTVTPMPPGTPDWAADGRLNILLVGSDAGPGRVGARPDATHVASVDVTTGKSVLFSLPRYLQFPPLPAEDAGLWPCGCFRGYVGTGSGGPYLNSIYTWATDHPNDFPGGDNRGWRAYQGTVETLLGLKIDFIVIVDLNGFVDAVDAIGGINIYVPAPVYDEHYVNEHDVDELVNIDAGWHHFDGHTALMYVRSRHQDGDIERLSRQQNFLRALQNQIAACGVNLLPKLPALLDAVQKIVQTNIPFDQVPALLDLLDRTKKPAREEFTSDNGFLEDLTTPGMVQLFQGTVQADLAGGAGSGGDGDNNPDPTPPSRLPTSC